jgi:hypothetical protein
MYTALTITMRLLAFVQLPVHPYDFGTTYTKHEKFIHLSL